MSLTNSTGDRVFPKLVNYSDNLSIWVWHLLPNYCSSFDNTISYSAINSCYFDEYIIIGSHFVERWSDVKLSIEDKASSLTS